ncbi:MAG: hypothetical protein A2749_01695 [Parcubacteria group bacterium RIFCSPHIGHO2_01_FULL_45_26]|nr:MAG: hypothetical protein A2749_01695 [Parcubacteria group bacterium RIFCSPHIGHO2_01_FULL_45_26]
MLPRRKFNWPIGLFFALITLLSALGVWWEFSNFHPATIVLALVLYLIYGFSITCYYHRRLTHKQFKMARGLEVLMAVCATGAILLTARKWHRRHDDHHKYTDNPALDPNCAQPGFWGFWDTHVWQVVCSRYQDRPIDQDEAIDAVEVWQERLYWPLASFMAILLPVAIASLWGDATGGLLIACAQRMLMQYNGAFLVNSAAHSGVFGEKPGRHWSSATNLAFRGWRLPVATLFVLMSLGEVLGHEVHHERPGRWDTGWRWLNPSSILLSLLNRLGLVWELRTY